MRWPPGCLAFGHLGLVSVPFGGAMHVSGKYAWHHRRSFSDRCVQTAGGPRGPPPPRADHLHGEGPPSTNLLHSLHVPCGMVRHGSQPTKSPQRDLCLKQAKGRLKAMLVEQQGFFSHRLVTSPLGMHLGYWATHALIDFLKRLVNLQHIGLSLLGLGYVSESHGAESDPHPPHPATTSSAGAGTLPFSWHVKWGGLPRKCLPPY